MSFWFPPSFAYFFSMICWTPVTLLLSIHWLTGVTSHTLACTHDLCFKESPNTAPSVYKEPFVSMLIYSERGPYCNFNPLSLSHTHHTHTHTTHTHLCQIQPDLENHTRVSFTNIYLFSVKIPHFSAWYFKECLAMIPQQRNYSFLTWIIWYHIGYWPVLECFFYISVSLYQIKCLIILLLMSNNTSITSNH